jgi:hypothetical protein
VSETANSLPLPGARNHFIQGAVMRLASLLFVVALACAGASVVRAQTAAAPAPAAPADALTVLNQQFRDAYREARKATIGAAGPVLVVQFDDLHLVQGASVRTERFTPPIYHEYKAIAHVPLALFVMLSGAADGALDPALRVRLASYRALLAAAGEDIARRLGWSERQRTLHREIVQRSLTLIDATLAQNMQRARLDAYTRAMRPLVLASADASARAQLDGLHALVTRWRAELGAKAWSAIQVVVLGPKQPRPGNLQYAYFRRALGAGAEGKRLWYAEGIFDRERGMELFGTILLDRKASVAFFGDAVRLERDMLADSAAAHIHRLFARPSR